VTTDNSCNSLIAMDESGYFVPTGVVKREPVQDFEEQEDGVIDLDVDRKDFRGILIELRTKFKGLVNIHSIYDELRGRAYLDEDFDDKGYRVQDTLNNESGSDPGDEEKDDLEAFLKEGLGKKVKEEVRDPLDDEWEPKKVKFRTGPVKPLKETRAWYVVCRYLLPMRNPAHKKTKPTSIAPQEPTNKCCVVLQPMSKELLEDYYREEDAVYRKELLINIRFHQIAWLRVYKHRASVPNDTKSQFGKFVVPRRCPLCPKGPASKTGFAVHDADAWDDHMFNIHGQKVEKVDCPKEHCLFRTYSRSMRGHVDYWHGGKSYPDPAANLPAKPVRGVSTCEICVHENREDVFTGSEAGLKSHKYKEHASHERALCPEDGCGKLIMPERLQWHLANIHNWGRDPHIKCPLCDWSGCHLGSFKSHVFRQHPGEDVPIPESKRHKNRGIGRGKRPKKRIKAEEEDGDPLEKEKKQPAKKKRKKAAELPRDVVCDQCGFATTCDSKLEDHINRVHLKIRPHACDQCDKAFNRASDLSNHKTRTHAAIKEFICDQCSYQCNTSYELLSHNTQIHDGQWTFKCKYEGCKYGAHRESKIARHVQAVHERLAQFKCPHCAHFGVERGNIFHHLRQVHRGIRRYTCNLCQFGAEKRNRLITHMGLDHNITVKLCKDDNKTLLSERPESITVYNFEADPDYQHHYDSIVRLETPVILGTGIQQTTAKMKEDLFLGTSIDASGTAE